jgi:hypothetical protein
MKPRLCFQWLGLRWSFATSAEVSGEISVSPAETGHGANH